MNKNERVLGRILATEELQLVAGGTTSPDEDTTCSADSTGVHDLTSPSYDIGQYEEK